MNKRNHYVCFIFLYLFKDYSVINQSIRIDTMGLLLWLRLYFVLDLWFKMTIRIFCNEPVNKRRLYVLSNLLNWLGVIFVLEYWYKQTLCVFCFTDLIQGLFGFGPVKKIRHYVLAILLRWFKGHSVINLWIKSVTLWYLIHWLV